MQLLSQPACPLLQYLLNLEKLCPNTWPRGLSFASARLKLIADLAGLKPLLFSSQPITSWGVEYCKQLPLKNSKIASCFPGCEPGSNMTASILQQFCQRLLSAWLPFPREVGSGRLMFQKSLLSLPGR